MIRTTLASLSLALGLALTACGGAAPSPSTPAGSSAAPLDGSSFDVTLAFPGEAPVKDTLRFAGGRFESTACTSVGFPQWSEYSAKGDGGAVAFTAQAKSADGATMDWKGTVNGGSVEATAVRTMGGKSATASVSGVRH
jgi:hypothetical protein